MRKVLSFGLVLTMVAAGVPAVLVAASQGEQRTARVIGTARQANGQLVSSASMRVRNYGANEIAARTTSGPSGEFSFEGLAPGRYIVEVVEAGRVTGMTSPFSVEPGMTLSVDVTVLSAALDSSDEAGFSLFGLGPAVSAAVLGAAGVAAVTAVVSTQPEASPSQ